MADSNHKRSNSFRKYLPNIFLGKSKSKNSNITIKNGCDIVRDNQYEAPKIQTRNLANDDDTSIVYENLSELSQRRARVEVSNGSDTLDSSSSTLTSEQVNVKSQQCSLEQKALDARSHGSRKPQADDVIKPAQKLDSETVSQYPDVYYHSLEELNDVIAPLNKDEIYRSPQRHDPHSVGAEIKKVSTKFLISPKKEAEVRKMQPKTARSFSLDQQTALKSTPTEIDIEDYRKPYNYSAPTSPTPAYHKLPNMPEKVSPYEHVKKSIEDSEENKNSLDKASCKKSSLIYAANKAMPEETNTIVTTPDNVSCLKGQPPQKIILRQKVEEFYWEKIKQLKTREDEYLKRSIKDPRMTNPQSLKTFQRNSFRAKPNRMIDGSRSFSLPRGGLKTCGSSPTYALKNVPSIQMDPTHRQQSICSDAEVVYRRQLAPSGFAHKERFLTSTPRDSLCSGSNKVSFDDRYLAGNTNYREHNNYKCQVMPGDKTKNVDTSMQGFVGWKLARDPPRPPLRTSSANCAILGQANKTVNNNVGPHFVKNYSLRPDPENTPHLCDYQRILEARDNKEEDWHGDGSRGDGGLSDGEATRGPSRSRTSRRDDPRRHTLAGNHLYLHPHHSGQINSLEMENNNHLFDDDPGIMSEVETASTGFRRGGKQRSSLPVVRTPSKTLERPLGLVFLQYRNETKRALLPNEITSIDTVKALFVRSFPKQLTMQYLDSPLVKIYIHDSSKDMFYELEDVRAHLRDIRDRSVLRLFESADMGGGGFPVVVGVGSVAMPPGSISCSGPSSWDQDQSYFSEPEIDSEYHHQHVHKSKVKAPTYYIGAPGTASTLPRGGTMLRAYSPAGPPVPADRVKNIPGAEGYMSSPERTSSRAPYEDPYYAQFMGPRATITPIIDEETSDGVIEDYHLYGVNATGLPPGARPMPRPPYDGRGAPAEEMQRLRVEKMERQLANLTGLVQKALQVPGAPPTAAPRQEFPQPTYQARPPPQDGARYGSADRPPKLGKDKFQKSVSFEKSVSFCEDPPDMNSPKQHSPQHSERDRLKPAPPPKPVGLVSQQLSLAPQRTYTITVTPEFFAQLHKLQKQSRDLMLEVRNMRRSTLSHAIQMRQLMADAIVKIGSLAASFCDHNPELQLSREEEIYRQDMLLLENDLYELEATVERLRGQAANRETRVNMSDIERIAMVLSKSSKTVADWKLKFPILQDTMKIKLSSEMEKVVRKEKLLEEEPERLELALRRCKKLTGTLVTLKRLACVQEQRLPITDGRVSPTSSQSSTFCSNGGPSSEDFASDSTCHITTNHAKGSFGRDGEDCGAAEVHRAENALDALLDELQTFAKPSPAAAARGDGPLRRLHSYPSGSDTDASPPVRARGHHPPKPPVPERHPELLALAARRPPPPPPPRHTARSPLASPTSHADEDCEDRPPRPATLEQRHQELLKKQRALQEQYARLQMIQRSGPALPPTAQPDLKKTGSESNLLTKMNLNLAPAATSGSLTHLGPPRADAAPEEAPDAPALVAPAAATTTSKVYETDIL